MLNDWERIARELGDYDLVIQSKEWEAHAELVRCTNEYYVGEWLPSELAAKEILRLLNRIEVLEGRLADFERLS